MPGIYLNDGGATSSALGNALSGLAGAMSPENQARAALLKLQSEQADWQNRLLSSQVPATEQAAGGVPGLLSTFGANAVPPDGGSGGGAGDGSVAGVVANAAQPPAIAPVGGPSARGVLNISSFTPFQKYLANEVAAGRLSPDALRSSVTLGQQATLGPGNTYATQEDVGKARQMPRDVSTGVTTYLDPSKAATGGTLQGPSPYEQTAANQQANKDIGEATTASSQGVQANDAIGELQLLQQLRNNVLKGDWTPGEIAFDEAAKKLETTTGIGFTRLNSRQDVLNAIKSRMVAMLGSTRQIFAGDPTLRGALDPLVQNLPNPESDQFDNSVATLRRSLQLQADDAKLADKFLQRPSPQGAVDWRAQRAGNHQRSRAEIEQSIQAGVSGDGSLPVITSPEEARKLGPGKRFRLPDGRTGTVPNG